MIISADAVAFMETVPHLFVLENGSVSAQPIRLLAEQKGMAYFASENIRNSSAVIVRGIAAIKGMLMGMGEEE